MAKCKICKTNIPDGKEYCSNCQDKENLISNESYLDGLLNSVKNTAPIAESIYNKKKTKSSDNNSHTETPSNYEEVSDQNDPAYSLDLADLEDFDQFSISDDLINTSNAILIGDEELFGDDLSDLFSDPELAPRNQDNFATEYNHNEEPFDNVTYEAVGETNNAAIDENHYIEGDTSSNNTSEMEGLEDILGSLNHDISEDDNNQNSEDPNLSIVDGMDIATAEALDITDEENFRPEEIAQFESDDNFDPDLNDLLNNLDTFQNNSYDSNISDKVDDTQNIISEGNPEQISEDDDILSLLKQISSEDPVAEDVKAINDLLSGKVTDTQKKADMPSDVGEVFSDALKVVTSLQDGEFNEAQLLSQFPESNKKGKKNKKQKTSKKKKADKDLEDKPKVSLFKRLFGNVKDGEDSKTEQESVDQVHTAKGKKPAKKTKAAKGKKEAAAALENDTPVKGKAKGKQSNKPDDGEEVSKGKKGKKDKKEKKEKKKKTKEVIKVIDEIEEDEGRINRTGAAIVFVFFALLGLIVFVGTNVVSYTLSIQNAKTYFDDKKYTEAYNEVYGIEIKDEDIELYDKIMTVMFVNKQLNSYNNYYSLGQYPQALDSLLKGLKRYDKYIELATILGIRTDLDYVRTQILAELDNVFNLSEEDAMKINAYDDMSVYSMEVYDVVLENMNN